MRFHALINAQTYTPGALKNIRIVGEGTIDGNGWLQQGEDGDGFRVAMPSTSATVSTNGVLAKAQVARASELGSKAPYPTRSNLIDLRGVTNAYYGGSTATNPANHTLVNINTKNVTVEGVRLETYSNNSSASGNNADGVEFINSTGLKVYDSVFDMGDDAVNLNARIGAEAAADTPTSNVWVFDNYFRNSHGAVVAGSFTGAWIQDVLAEDNVITIGDVALRMKTGAGKGAVRGRHGAEHDCGRNRRPGHRSDRRIRSVPPEAPLRRRPVHSCAADVDHVFEGQFVQGRHL